MFGEVHLPPPLHSVVGFIPTETHTRCFQEHKKRSDNHKCKNKQPSCSARISPGGGPCLAQVPQLRACPPPAPSPAGLRRPALREPTPARWLSAVFPSGACCLGGLCPSVLLRWIKTNTPGNAWGRKAQATENAAGGWAWGRDHVVSGTRSPWTSRPARGEQSWVRIDYVSSLTGRS